MRRLVVRGITVVLCVLALAVFVNPCKVSAADPIKIKLATGAEEWLSAGKGYGKFAELVNERGKGKIEVEVFFSGALGNEVTAIRNLLGGTVEMAACSDANVGAFNDAFFFMNLPYVFSGTEGLRKVVNEPWVREKLNEGLAKSNMRLLMVLDNGGFRHVLTNKKQVKTPDDIKGLKIRTTASKVEVASFKNFGALPTPIDWGEVYTALEQGTVDGEGLMYTWMYSTKHHEVVKYVCENEYVIGTQNLFTRVDFWNKLPKDIQELIMECARDAEIWEAQVDAEYVQQAKEGVQKAGVVIYRPTEAEMKAWKDCVVPDVWEQFGDKVSMDFLKKIEDLQK